MGLTAALLRGFPRMMDTKRVGKITEDRLRSYIKAVLMHYERQNNALQHTF
jgi:hypothetical protein